MDEAKNKYAIVERSTTLIVSRGFHSRQAARIAKRELEYKIRAANEHRNMPSHYYVETDIDHPNGAGIYCR